MQDSDLVAVRRQLQKNWPEAVSFAGARIVSGHQAWEPARNTVNHLTGPRELKHERALQRVVTGRGSLIDVHGLCAWLVDEQGACRIHAGELKLHARAVIVARCLCCVSRA